MRRAILILAVLAPTWLLLSGHFNGLLLALGALSCLAGYLLYVRSTQQAGQPPLGIGLLRLMRYVCWLMVEIFKSNVLVIWAIIQPQRMKPEFFTVDSAGLDEDLRAAYANSITLTPGTLAIDADAEQLEVHSLVAESRESLEQGVMLKQVRRLRKSQES